jgi:hypothetical protein
MTKVHEMPVNIFSPSDVIQLKAERPLTPPALQVASPTTPILALDINQSEQESSIPPPSSQVASRAPQNHVSTPRSPSTNVSGASNVIQSKPATPVPRQAFQAILPNTLSCSPSKEVPQVIAKNVNLIPHAARNISSPADRTFFSFLNNKIKVLLLRVPANFNS